MSISKQLVRGNLGYSFFNFTNCWLFTVLPSCCFLHIDPLGDESNQWVFLENIYALFSIVLNTPLKNPMNFDMSFTELIRSGNTMEKWENENWKNPSPQPTEVSQYKNNSCTLKPKTEFSFNWKQYRN